MAPLPPPEKICRAWPMRPGRGGGAWSECLFRPTARCLAGRNSPSPGLRTDHRAQPALQAAPACRSGVAWSGSRPCAPRLPLLSARPCRRGAGGSFAALPSGNPLWRLAIGSSWPDQWLQLGARCREMAITSRGANLSRHHAVRGSARPCSPHPGTLQRLFPPVTTICCAPPATGLLFNTLSPFIASRPHPERGSGIWGFTAISSSLDHQAHWIGWRMPASKPPLRASIKVAPARRRLRGVLPARPLRRLR